MTDRNPSPPPTDTVSQLTHYIDVLHGQIRAYAGKGKRKWAAAASEALYSAVEELRAASAEVARAREEADVQRERYYELFESAPDGYLVTDGHGTVLDANRAACRLLGVPPRYIVRKPLVVYVTQEDRERYYGVLNRLREEVDADDRIRLQPRGAQAPITIHLRAATTPGIDGVSRSIRWILRDISQTVSTLNQLAASREQLRQLASELAQAEQRERRRIAEGIHDHAVQSLALAKMTLSSALRGLPQPNAAAVAEGTRLVGEAMEELRTLIFELAPPVLYELGLGPAVEWLADLMGKRHGLPIEVRCDIPADLPAMDWRVSLFHAIRELLINAGKHAHATRVTITLRRNSRGIRISVIDNGRGMPESAAPADDGGGFGLFSLRNRLEHMGGRVHIRSSRNRGTCVKLLVPLPVELRKAAQRHSTAASRDQRER